MQRVSLSDDFGKNIQTSMLIYIVLLQIIWEHTSSIGCAMSRCASGASIWVCEYGWSGQSAISVFVYNRQKKKKINAWMDG
jgi:hypothetical protein